MGQEDVLRVLKKAGRPLTSTEIAARVNINARSVRRILQSLLHDVSINIKFIRLTTSQKRKRYGRYINPSTIGVYILR